MSRSRSRGSRVARGAVAATLATWVALLSHLAGGGTLPGWLGIAVPWVLALAVCTVLAGHSLSLVRLSIAVAVSQLLFHMLFVVGLVTSDPAAPAAVHGHDHGAMTLTDSTAMIHPDAGMWAAHVVAAVVTIAVLHRGERAVSGLRAAASEIAAALASSLRRVAAVAHALAAPLRPLARPILAAETEPRAPLGWHPTSLARRGPPALLAF